MFAQGHFNIHKEIDCTLWVETEPRPLASIKLGFSKFYDLSFGNRRWTQGSTLCHSFSPLIIKRSIKLHSYNKKTSQRCFVRPKNGIVCLNEEQSWSWMHLAMAMHVGNGWSWLSHTIAIERKKWTLQTPQHGSISLSNSWHLPTTCSTKSSCDALML